MIERRNLTVEASTEEIEMRAESNEDGSKYIMGYAALTNSPSRPITERINGRDVTFIERIDSNAFDNAIMDDIVYLIDHDPSKLVGRQGANLEVKRTERGLFFKSKVIDTTISKDLYVAVQERLYKDNSFGFRVDKDEWFKQDGQLYQNIKSIGKIVDVSTTIKGAYSEPFVFTRSLDENVIKEIDVPTDLLVDDVEKNAIDFEFLKLKAIQF